VVEVLLIDYPTLRLAEALSKRWTVPPLAFTALALLARILAAVAFVEGLLPWGAIGVFAGMLFDGTDGKLARIQSHDAERVGALDFISDQVATLVLVGALIFRLSPVGTLAAISAYAWLALYVLQALARCNAGTGVRIWRTSSGGIGQEQSIGEARANVLVHGSKTCQIPSDAVPDDCRFRIRDVHRISSRAANLDSLASSVAHCTELDVPSRERPFRPFEVHRRPSSLGRSGYRPPKVWYRATHLPLE